MWVTMLGHRLFISSEDVGTYKKGGFIFDGMVWDGVFRWTIEAGDRLYSLLLEAECIEETKKSYTGSD